MPDYLILKPSSLGDIVHALVVVQSLKSQQPQARISWVVRHSFAPLIASTGLADELLTFDRKGGLPAFWSLLRKIRQKRHHAVLDMQGLFRTGLMNLAARAPRKLCRSDAREGAQLFAHTWVPLPKNSRHAVDILAEFLPALGLQKKVLPLQLEPALPCPDLPTGTVLIFPSSRGHWAQKEWPHFAQLTLQLLQLQLPVAWCSDVQLSVPDGALDYCGKVKMEELLPFISQARLVIANDAGPVHMAAALSIPVLGLYGPTQPALVGPYPPQAPQNIALLSPTGRMEDLSVAEVFAAATRLLAQRV